MQVGAGFRLPIHSIKTNDVLYLPRNDGDE